MELATDIMAIIGWALFGSFIPAWLELFSEDEFCWEHQLLCAISFGLIAASFVLG